MKNISLLSRLVVAAIMVIPLNSSAQWKRIRPFITASSNYYGVNAFAVVGTNLFAGGNSDKGVFLSSDNGTTWTAVNSGLPNINVNTFAVIGNSLFAGYDHGVFLSTNYGTSWAAVNSDFYEVSSFAIDGTNLFAGTAYGVFLSTNYGSSWASAEPDNVNLGTGGVTAMAIIPNAAGGTTLFTGDNYGLVYRSTDKGAHWTNSGSAGHCIYSFAVMGNNLFAGTDNGVYLSSDNGTSWIDVNSGLPIASTFGFTVYSFAVVGTNLFAGSDYYRVYLSTDKGASWTSVNYGMSNTADPQADDRVNALAVSGSNIFAGTQYGGWWRRPLSEMTTGTMTPTSPVLLTANVDTVWCNGTIGQMIATSSATFSVAAANELTASAPSSAILASVVGSGRAVGYSHDGFVTDANIQRYDNLAMAVNAIKWLDVNNKKSLLIASGHGEFTNLSNTSVLKTQLQQLGYSVNAAAGSLASTTISNYGVVMIGNAWGAITQAELDSLSHYVQRGGGLLMLGLGWSYLSYNAGKTLDDYPMNKVGDLCGMRWTGGTISDPSHSVSGAPLFLTFYPNIRTQGFTAATAFIDSVTRAKNSALPSTLQSDAITRTLYVNAHLYIRSLTSGLADTSQMRKQIYSYLTSLIGAYPSLFKRSFSYDTTTQSTMAWLRELVHRTLRDAVPLNATVKSEIAATLGLSGSYQEIWNTFGILLLDNFRLSTSQKGSIQRLLTLTPFPLYASLSCISVRDFLGTSLVDIPLLINSGDLSNVSATEVGSVLQNQFPVDISSRTIDIFSAVAAHEVNHIVDFHTVRPSAKLSARENALIAAAGVDSMNYCRSMFSPGVFISSPQEFFASLSNEWFADSRNTLNLAVKRFKGGRPQPLNQFVFFADVYSQGSDTTLFYTLDAQGILARTSVKLHRNASSFIDALVLPDSTFTLAVDGSGNVSNLSMSKTTAVEILAGVGIPTAFQLLQNYPNPFNPSTSIQYQIPQAGQVSLRVYNTLGEEVATLVSGYQNPGVYRVQWSPQLPSGVYLYRLQVGTFVQSRKLILLK